jgi:hypothetical protein
LPSVKKECAGQPQKIGLSGIYTVKKDAIVFTHYNHNNQSINANFFLCLKKVRND